MADKAEKHLMKSMVREAKGSKKPMRKQLLGKKPFKAKTQIIKGGADGDNGGDGGDGGGD